MTKELFWLILYLDMITFLVLLLNNFTWVFVPLGSIILSGMLYDWYLDRYREIRTGDWKKSMHYIVLQIYPPKENRRSLAEMESLFTNLFSIFEERNPKDTYLIGKWHEGMCFEIHSDGGKVGFYLRVNKWYEGLVRDSFDARYPGTKLVEVPDPMGQWPRDWTGQIKYKYKNFFGSDVNYTAHDAHPVRIWQKFQDGNNPPVNDPIYELISLMENINPDDYAIFKLAFRPFDDKSMRQEMRDEVKKLRKEFSENASVYLNGNAENQDNKESRKFHLLTDDERETLNQMIIKSGAPHAKTKIRFGYFTNKPKPGAYEGHINGYFQQFTADIQGLVCCEYTRTNQDAHGGKDMGAGYNFPVLRNAIVSAYVARVIDLIYWKREREYRKQKIYSAILSNENTQIGEPPDFMEAASLASIFHMPTTYDENAPFRAQHLQTHYGQEDSLVKTAQPPADLPT